MRVSSSSCSVHPSRLPPLAFIRTVDGESRAGSGTDTDESPHVTVPVELILGGFIM